MNKKLLCVDIDNVLAQTDKVMRLVIWDVTEGRVNLQYEDVTIFEYHLCQDTSGNCITRDEWELAHTRFSEDRYILAVEPFPGVQQHRIGLMEKFELHFVTSRLPKARKATILWLERHGFPDHALHFLVRGKKHVSLRNFTAAIEDDRDQAIEFARDGVPCILLAHPWNKIDGDVTDVYRVSDWNGLVAIIHEQF